LLDYPNFKNAVAELTEIDLSSYKSQQMDRRINSLMQIWGLETYDEFLEVLKTNPQKYKEFVKKLTINVSEFFRNSERFYELWKKIMPQLLKKPQIRIWSAGCSDGAEPYSIAIVVQELGASDRVKILASDVDKIILAKAEQAVYGFNEVKSLPPDLLSKYFENRDNLYYLNDTTKGLVQFYAHNLLLDDYASDLDLIICRNVVIYFTEQAKGLLYQKFLKALSPGGYLMVGGTEPILAYRQLGFENPLTSFYRKPE
jgi:chemotaxis protein methyltransferase CheR